MAGLTVQTTSRKRLILCKLRDGKPITEHVVDDYIFIGSLDDLSRELTDRTVNKICDFIRTNCGEADTIKNTARVWRNGIRMYESNIAIMNENVQEVADKLIIG